jgi:hypothetical protein
VPVTLEGADLGAIPSYVVRAVQRDAKRQPALKSKLLGSCRPVPWRAATQPRAGTYDAKVFRVKRSEDVPASIRERAYTWHHGLDAGARTSVMRSRLCFVPALNMNWSSR